MELIERAEFLASLQDKFESTIKDDGHCVMVSGEAGMGKTSLIRAFCREDSIDRKIYQGTCDALFSPRPLAPLYDIALQMGIDLWQNGNNVSDMTGLFTRFFHEISKQREPVVVIFEDVHWADEATLDFIKFLARRITQLHCLFILTYRDNEIHSLHPLRNVLGQLPTHSFTRLQLTPLSRCAVEKLAMEKGYSGEDVYSISGGNPFYVTEILASYSSGVPDNIKDSILSVFNRQVDETKRVWEILSVLPTGIEPKYLERIEPAYITAVEYCLDSGILVLKKGLISFKHELYRRTVETSLSPLLRVNLNKHILDLFLKDFEENLEIERIIHHAKNANEYELVVFYAPIAAKQAACVGAHVEASKLYYSAIEYYQGNDKDKLIEFYEAYAYECYLIGRIQEAIIYQGKALNLWKEKNDTEKIGNCLRFLSRLWWYNGNRKKAELYGNQAIDALSDQPSSRAKAMAYSNMSQLKMLSDESAECIFWGEIAIVIAKELDDEEILAHALNNIGTVQMDLPSTKQKAVKLLQQSLNIALKHSYHEHAARAYVNLTANAVKMKDYDLAKKTMDEGIEYCEKRELDSWTTYLLAFRSRSNLETGNWDEAYQIAEGLMRNENPVTIVKLVAMVVIATINMRKGEGEVLPLLNEAKATAFETMELQRIIPVFVALLEYEWLTGKEYIEKVSIDHIVSMIESMGHSHQNNDFAFWMKKVRNVTIPLRESYDIYDLSTESAIHKAAAHWGKLDCNYMKALCLFEGCDADKVEALSIVQKLGANPVYEKMKLMMRASGIKNIPRGIRKSTMSNPSFLTQRELDVLQLLKEGMPNKEIADNLFISAKTVDHHVSSILLKLNVNSRAKAVQEAISLEIIK